MVGIACASRLPRHQSIALANAAIFDALAGAFGVRRSAVAIVRGEHGRRKTVSIAGCVTGVLERLAALRARPTDL